MNIDLTKVPDEELFKLRKSIDSEWIRRETSKPTHWKCEICGYTSDFSGSVVKHLKKFHHYPHEDACLSTIPVYVEK